MVADAVVFMKKTMSGIRKEVHPRGRFMEKEKGEGKGQRTRCTGGIMQVQNLLLWKNIM